ncbi:CPBP family intramembrane glutamic endopeptidase [Microbacterium sp. OR16]|uniref:CPBP family intramembrane glutamic endopeptidase n=1 Tax=Microbacterium sp. OR16 TaxID=3095345 RepID=UPI0039B41F18
MRSRGVYERPWLAVGLALAAVVVSSILTGAASATTLDGVAKTGLIALAATGPLLLAAIVVPWVTTSAQLSTAVGLHRFSGLDLLLGLSAGIVLRAVAELNTPTSGGWSIGRAGAGVLLSLVIAVAVSPFVEELFFRGVLQRALGDALRPSGPAVAASISVVSSSAVFAALHSTTGASVAALSTLLLVGFGCGALVAMTGRLAAAVIAHHVYNLIGVGLLLL